MHAINEHVRTEEIVKINKLSSYLEILENKGKITQKRRRKERKKLKQKAMREREPIKRKLVFESINKTDNPLERLTRKKKRSHKSPR
jgi:hypothetical protein